MKSYKFDIESIKKLTKQMVVLINTREKRNEHILSYFDKQGITYRKEKLDQYSGYFIYSTFSYFCREVLK